MKSRVIVKRKEADVTCPFLSACSILKKPTAGSVLQSSSLCLRVSTRQGLSGFSRKRCFRMARRGEIQVTDVGKLWHRTRLWDTRYGLNVTIATTSLSYHGAISLLCFVAGQLTRPRYPRASLLV